MTRFIAWGLALFGAAVALTTTLGVYFNYSPVPFWDQWYGVVDWYMRAEQDWWPAFWSQHNEHRLLFSRPIFWADMRYFGGVNILSLIANLVTCGFLALAVYRAGIFKAPLSNNEKIGIAGLVLAVCFSWMQSENFTWGFQNQWFAVYLFAVMSFQSLCVCADRGGSYVWLFAAIICGVASAFSMASGLLTLPLLLLLSIALSLSRVQQILIFTAAALVWIANFSSGNSSTTGIIPKGNLLYAISHDPLGLFQFTISYIGAPMWFAFGSQALAILLGLLLFVGSAYGAWLIARDARGISAKPLLALSCMLCLTAVITAGGRLVLGINNVFQGRYATSGLLAVLCLCLFYYFNLSSASARGRMQTLVSILLVGLCLSQIPSLFPNHDLLFNKLVAGEAARENVLDDVYLKQLWERTDALRKTMAPARNAELTIFARHVPQYADHTEFAQPTKTCRGSIDVIEPTATSGMMKASGWLYDTATGSVPRTLVITDASGSVIGQGVSGAARPDVAAYLHTAEKRFGWVAFFKQIAARPSALGDTGTGLCRVGP